MSPPDARAAPTLTKAMAPARGYRCSSDSSAAGSVLPRDPSAPGNPGTSSQAAGIPSGLKPQRDALSLGLDPGGGPKVVRGSAPGSVLLLAVLGVDHGSPRCRHLPVSRASSQGVCP